MKPVIAPVGGTGQPTLIPDTEPLIFHSAYLRRCDVFPPLDVQQSQDVVDIGIHVVKTRGHPTLLVAEERAAVHNQRSSVIKQPSGGRTNAGSRRECL